MRKSIVPFALAMFTAASVPARAANFACTFYENGKSVRYCPDALDCRHTFSSTLHGVCVTAEQQIGCIFSAEQFRAADVLVSPEAGAGAAAPSFFARTIAEASTKRLNVGYMESRTAPQVLAICTPIP
jgi:hypothetical protein